MFISSKDDQKLTNSKKSFWEEYLKFRKRVNLKEDGLEPEDFTDLRDKSVGREVDIWVKVFRLSKV